MNLVHYGITLTKEFSIPFNFWRIFCTHEISLDNLYDTSNMLYYESYKP